MYKEHESKRLKSNLTLLITAAIWGFAFVAQKDASKNVSAFAFNGIRFIIGALSLIPVICIFEKKYFFNREKLVSTIKCGAIAGTVLFAASFFQQKGVEALEQASSAGFITGLYTVLVPLIGLVFGKKPSINAAVGAVFAVAGLYFTCMSETLHFETGDLLLLAGSFFWAFHIIVIDSFIKRINPVTFSSVQFLTCGLINIILCIVFEADTFSLQNVFAAAVPMLYAGIMSCAIAYTLQVIGQKNARPTEASIILSTESVFGCIGCMLILGERLSLRSLFGCILIFAGIVVSQLKFKRDGREPTPKS